LVVSDVHWIGLLCNVDSSILQLKLPDGFEVSYFAEDEAIDHFIQLDKISKPSEFVIEFSLNRPCFNDDEKRIYYLHRSELLDVDIRQVGRIVSYPVSETDRLYDEKIRKIVRLMRLLGEGDIRVPYDYSYYEVDGQIESFITRYSTWHISNTRFHFNEDDQHLLNKLNKRNFPFKKNFIQLSFENYEDSYEAQHPILSFMSLMIAMEALFNPGSYELRYRISRNCAVLLGKSKEESLKIFSQLKTIYDIRSRIIHSGNQSEFDNEYISILRHYVREAIKMMIFIDEDKDVTLSKLNTLGFGEIENYDSVVI